MDLLATPPESAGIERIHAANVLLGRLSAKERIKHLLGGVRGKVIASTSFGLQSAVLLHLWAETAGRRPVVFIDTGYLFPETLDYATTLTARLGLDVRTWRPDPARAWSQAETSELREGGADALAAYNDVHKVRPFRQALRELNAEAWVTGIRREQSTARKRLDILSHRFGCWRLSPLADWSDEAVWRYLDSFGLPRHPLDSRGYRSIGDTHSTEPPGAADTHGRFFGLRRECGLHFDTDDG